MKIIIIIILYSLTVVKKFFWELTSTTVLLSLPYDSGDMQAVRGETKENSRKLWK
ncbi:hypothetical protein DES34_12182 [Brevibacillus brevis]|nr:hypothetical protein DES34_12182 [Brevibacillus brevis]GEC91707.1 hypothetical protein BBR01nite_40380 [Brevibacillus brevis]VEF91928.1 Uncharacterised protein [Brevibacillus brevis]